jgi:hypothetical protein
MTSSYPTLRKPGHTRVSIEVSTVHFRSRRHGPRASSYAARPILAAHGMYATFYVNSPRLGSSSFLTWKQVQDLYSDGNEIGGHMPTEMFAASLGTAGVVQVACVHEEAAASVADWLQDARAGVLDIHELRPEARVCDVAA